MDKTAQLIAIAKAHGFVDIEFSDKPGFQYGWHGKWGRDDIPPPSPYSGHLPDYLGDLNAIHEAEKHVFSDDITLWSEYEVQIHRTFLRAGGQWRPLLSATAAQRAEAFLKTINLWKET